MVWFQWTRNINKWSSVPMEQKIERTVKMNGEMNYLKQEIMELTYICTSERSNL